MKISTKGRYGLRAMLDLALHSENTHVSLSSIAERQNVSLNYLEQAFSTLKKNGLVKSVKGAQGGYILAEPPEKTTIYRILNVLEGDLSIVDESEMDASSVLQNCIRKNVWDKIDDQVKEIFGSTTLRDLMDEYKKVMETHEPMYFI